MLDNRSQLRVQFRLKPNRVQDEVPKPGIFMSVFVEKS